jgi:putative membrane protein
LREFVSWTRGMLYVLVALSIVPALLYSVAGLTWLTIPWGVIFMLGTTVALSAGFRTLQTYGRLQEAQQTWASIVATSRIWGGLCRDVVDDRERARELVYRHFAWLAALRHQLRGARVWETSGKAYNLEYARRFSVEEHENSLEEDLAQYVDRDDAADILSSRAKALEALNLQSRQTRDLLQLGAVSSSAFVDLQKALRDLQDAQSRVERIKNHPYPRQHAFINTLFVRILCVLLPFGVVGEFAHADASGGGVGAGYLVWLGVPLSVLISWMYVSLDRVGESTENPFEGSANDVPITLISAEIEADLRAMLGEVEVTTSRVGDADVVM